MIRITNLTMTYRTADAQHMAVKDVSIDVEQGQFYTLLGPSGCGKTTTLRCVAGLERPDSGEIVVGGNTVCSSANGIWVAPNLRNIGMVFQSYAIWPHMSVFDNVAFPLRHMNPRPAKAEIRDKVLGALALVKLDGLENRLAPFLSGGQQQRLALARALVAEPSVLLLDEPLSNLDAKLREEMRFEVRELVKRLNITTLFVTHEQIEALTMSDVIAVMSDGEIVQEGFPAEIYAAPKELFVADFIGRTNFLTAKVLSVVGEDGTGHGRVDSPVGELTCGLAAGIQIGDSVVLAIRPENVAVYTDDAVPSVNSVEGKVDVVVFLGNILECIVKVADQRINVQLHPAGALERGNKVLLHFPSQHLLAIPQ